MVGLWAGSLEATTEFSFVVPTGWTDLSPAAPAENFKGFPDAIVREAMSDRYLAYAVDRPAGRDDVAATFNALRLPTRGRITEARLERILEGMVSKASADGLTINVIARSLVDVSGAKGGRITYDVVVEGDKTRHLLYVLPGLEHGVALTYSTAAEDFARYQPVFEASAAGTRGVREPTFVAQLFQSRRMRGTTSSENCLDSWRGASLRDSCSFGYSAR
jgi:hypothetical protein